MSKFIAARLVFAVLWNLVAIVSLTYSYYLFITQGFVQEAFNFFFAGHLIGINARGNMKKLEKDLKG